MSWLTGYFERNNHRFEPMKKYIRQHDTIADLGIGAGGYYHQENIKEVVGVDRDGVLLKRAREFNPQIQLIKADVCKTGLPDKKFSLVVLSHIIEHLENYEPLIKEAKRICQDNGYFLIGLPIDHPSPVHFYPKWTRDDVEKLVKEFGILLGLEQTKDSWIVYVQKT